MDVEEIKLHIIRILENDISFEGHFNKIIKNTNENFHSTLLDWVKECKEQRQRIHTSKRYKNLVVFLFKPNITNIRGGINQREK